MSVFSRKLPHSIVRFGRFLPVTTTKSDGQIQCKWQVKAADNAEGKNFR
jgi:hypothetical protein